MALPFALPSLASGLLWKIGTGAAVVAAIVVTFFLFQAQRDNRNLMKERDKLSLAITDPKTGYIARLTQANANIAMLENAIASQNAAMLRESKAGALKIEALKKELAAAQRRSTEAERRLATFMATKPRGNTLEERVNDVDRRILQDLNR